VALVSMQETETGDTLSDSANPVVLERMRFPDPVISVSVQSKLKAEQEKVKSEQMELKREATAAAAALPTFTYRTGFLGITAADKSWQISFSHEFHAHMYNWPDGNDSDGFTTGDIFLRRNRPFIYYCWDDCLYEIGWGAD
jgi:hypothetical protein